MVLLLPHHEAPPDLCKRAPSTTSEPSTFNVSSKATEASRMLLDVKLEILLFDGSILGGCFSCRFFSFP